MGQSLDEIWRRTSWSWIRVIRTGIRPLVIPNPKNTISRYNSSCSIDSTSYFLSSAFSSWTKSKNTLKKQAKKIKHYQYIVPGFAHRLYQKLKTIYQDRTRRALSNAYLCCSIPVNVGVGVGDQFSPTPKLTSSGIEQQRYAFDRARRVLFWYIVFSFWYSLWGNPGTMYRKCLIFYSLFFKVFLGFVHEERVEDKK